MSDERDEGLLELFRADCAAVGVIVPMGPLAAAAMPSILVRSRSLRVILLIRLMQGTPRWLSHVWRRLLICHGCDVPRESVAGPGLRMPHAYGVVIGANTTVGRDVTLHQNVCLTPADRDWRRRPGGSSGRTRIGDRVEIGAGAVILGNVQIGDASRIEPLSVVNESLPAGTVFANAPTITPEQLPGGVEKVGLEPSPGAGLVSLLVALGAGSGSVARAARRVLAELFQVSVGPGSRIAPGALALPRYVTIEGADVRAGARLGSRVTINGATGSSPAVIGEHALVEPGAVVIGSVNVRPGTVVLANHVLMREERRDSP